MADNQKLIEVLRREAIGVALSAFDDYQVEVNGEVYAGKIEDLDEALEGYAPSQILKMLRGMNIGDYAIFDKNKGILAKATESDLRGYMVAVVQGEKFVG